MQGMQSNAKTGLRGCKQKGQNMINKGDERLLTKSPMTKMLKIVAQSIIDNLVAHRKEDEEYDYGMYRIQERKVVERVDKLLMGMDLEIDATSVEHAHGIGNNNSYKIVDKDMLKAGEFYCNTDMYSGVYVGFTIDGETIAKAHYSGYGLSKW